MDYKETLNLPKTDFPMKAGLAEQEPVRVAKWQKGDLYNKILKKREGSKKFVLHDGPPYANGNIHMGTALNKILKDFVVKSKAGFGYYSPYIPGWDCHGLPIEHKVDKELGDKKAQMTKNDIRKLCRDYAQHWLDVQRESFKRLGVLGDWDNPYITMDYKYESVTLNELYRVVKEGNVYKGHKPVYWCSTCVTALAEAEVEYADHTSDSIFVKFSLLPESLEKIGMTEPVSAVIWTTTPWTLPANMAISANPNEMYSVMRVGFAESKNLKEGELLLIATPLTNSELGLKDKLDIADWTEVKQIPAKELELIGTRHPFYDRVSPIILGEHVLMTDGTGLVHTAPAHGVEDYIVSKEYGIDVFNPVDDFGVYKQDLPLFGGKTLRNARKEILELLDSCGALIKASKLVHSYPHCWRCKEPLIYRATPQWFISMEHKDLRKKAVNAIKNEVKWIPSWGENRILSMVESRPDWCISRQRSWGVPIALFTCEDCGEIVMSDETMKKVVDSFVEMGADAWFEHDTEYYLGKDPKCPKCGSGKIFKETDILDVWFDSGTSHAAVCEERKEINGRADMYLEGSDQHRGWFQSSLLESVATRGVAPFREVLTHGYVVDGKMKKMSKSVGNVIAPEELIGKFGAEIVRLWVAAEDYTGDISISQDIIKRLTESYRKIRNTSRYLLGSLNGFNPDTDMVDFKDMMELDRYALLKWQDCLEKIYTGYENYQFHAFYHSFLNFCINDLSSLYLDIIKDRTYSYGAGSKQRKSAQTVMFMLAKEMTTVMSPVLSFTADEIWDYLPEWKGKEESVFEELFPPLGRFRDDALRARFDKLINLRKAVNKALELARAEKIIGHPLDAKVVAGVKNTDGIFIDEELQRFLIVSEAEVVPFESVDNGTVNETGDITVKVEPSAAPKCARCWTHSYTVGKKSEELCERCADVLESN